MSRARRRVKWGHPLIVGVAVALIGALGAVTAAIISSGDGSGPAEAGSPLISGSGGIGPAKAAPLSADIAIQGAEQDPLPDGGLLLTVHGTAHLDRGHVLYVVAQPKAPPPSSRWFASGATTPDSAGLWLAKVRIGPPPRPFTWQAVEGLAEPRKRRPGPVVRPTPTTGSTGTTTGEPPPPRLTRRDLQRLGPAAPGVSGSSGPFNESPSRR